MEINPETLISLVEERIVLWDKTLDIYKIKNLRTDAWNEICSILKADFKELDEKEKKDFVKMVTGRWGNIRDTWQKSMRRKKDEEISGSSTKKSRDYIYLRKLNFLTKKLYSDTAQEPSVKRARKETEQNEYEASEICELRVPPRKDKKRNYNEIDEKFVEFLETRINAEKESHHLYFFKGVLPILDTFNDDETLEFQSSVLSIIQNIKSKRNCNQRVPHNNTFRQSGNGHHYSENSNMNQRKTYIVSSLEQNPYSPTTSTSLQSGKSADSDHLEFEEIDSKHSIKILDE